MKSIFVADDGRQFENYESCEAYEKKLKEEKEKKERLQKTKEARRKEIIEAHKKYIKLFEDYLKDYPSEKNKWIVEEDPIINFLMF